MKNKLFGFVREIIAIIAILASLLLPALSPQFAPPL
jgi:hypothetical protein